MRIRPRKDKALRERHKQQHHPIFRMTEDELDEYLNDRANVKRVLRALIMQSRKR